MMEKKKILHKLIGVTMTALTAFSLFSGVAFAETKKMGIEEYRKPDSQGKQTGYAFDIAKKIWKVVTYDGASRPNYDASIYCIKAEQGFYDYTNGSDFRPVDYDLSYDFKNKAGMTSGIGLPVPSQYYNQILWILDHAYMPSSSTAAADKTFLLRAAGIADGSEITDDDIEVVQQMAIWYYTNYDNHYYHDDDATGPILKPIKFSTKTSDGVTTAYQNIDDYDMYRYDDMYTLYQYLVSSADPNYESSSSSAPVGLDAQTPVVEDKGDTYILGPYRINKYNDLAYNITNKTGFTTGDASNTGSPLTGYTLLNSSKVPVTSGTGIADLVGQNFYISIPKGMQIGGADVNTVRFNFEATYQTTGVTYWTKSGDNTVQPLVIIEKQTPTVTGHNVVNIPKVEEKQFDLALRKFISKVGNVTVDRQPQVDLTNLNKIVNGVKVTTANYNHTKNPLSVKVGDEIIYTIRVYNEGEVDGYASEVTDYLPAELEFVNDDFNASYGWTCQEQGDVDGTIVRRIRTTALAKNGILDQASAYRPNGAKLSAYQEGSGRLDYIDLEVKCRVRNDVQTKNKITNIAEITNDTDANGNPITDRDSTPHNVVVPNDSDLPNYKDDEIASQKPYIPGQQDDDDFEKIKVEAFDLSLRKFISAKNNVSIIGRTPNVDVTNLANGTKTTANYNHTKKPMDVQKGDIITYTIRVYNEGDIDGYANEITDHLPEELEFLPEDELNKQYEWTASTDGRTIKTTYLSKEKESEYPRGTENRYNLLHAFNGTDLDDYKEVKVNCKVKDTAVFGRKITNLAEISVAKDKNGDDIIDRDSQTNNQVIPPDSELPAYKDDEIASGKAYIPGQQDDDDFEKLRIVYFDLALRKFITGVDETPVTDRIPQLSIGKDGNIHYEHTKVPVEVMNGNVVTYTLRIYNEGLMDGYAAKVVDDVPQGLEFLPEHDTNKEYRWTLSEDGKQIITDYLSKEQEKTEGANLIKAFDPEKGISSEEPYNPDYRDIKIAFKVVEPNTSDRIVINTAEIEDDRGPTNDPIEDVDSTPGNNNEWNEEDDLDKEFVKVKYFDLALKKWVSKVILIEDGKQTVTDTGHTGDENPEPVVKVELHRKKLDKVTVKFEFQIKVTNEGEIAGYVKELKDHIPEGLKFLQEDNEIWTPVSDKVVSTRALENVLLQPGESASVPIILTWINSKDNLGVKTNIAEISEDYNEADDTPDIDSTPDNEVPGEDDIDDAPVMLAVETGKEETYLGLGFLILITVAGGIVLIKKFVL